MIVGLVSCGKRKHSVPLPAYHLYSSGFFSLSVSVALQQCDRVYIVSALHGILDLDAWVEPYDYSLRDMDKKQRKVWACSIRDHGLTYDHAVFYGGCIYYDLLASTLENISWYLGGESLFAKVKKMALVAGTPRKKLPCEWVLKTLHDCKQGMEFYQIVMAMEKRGCNKGFIKTQIDLMLDCDLYSIVGNRVISKYWGLK